MTNNIFDTLKNKKDLESVGVPSHQAEKHIEVMGKIINSHLATKDEINNGMLMMRYDFDKKFSKVQLEFAAVRSEMASEFAAVRSEMAEQTKTINEQTLKYISVASGILGLMLTIFGVLITIK